MNGNIGIGEGGERHLYAVLNLSKDATQAEINERHRALSLIFHPDKQPDEQRKAAATKQFLEIQKAYQVLSDSFLRQVYDSLGFEGLKMQWPPSTRSKSKEEIQEILEQDMVTLKERKIRGLISPRGRMSCSLNASSIFGSSTGFPSLTHIHDGMRKIRVMTKTMAYSIEKKVSGKTTIGFEAESVLQDRSGTIRFLGTVRHQFSPRITTLATLHLTKPHITKFDVKYEDGNNLIEVKASLSPGVHNSLPTLTTSYSRKLSRNWPQRGRVALNISQQPSISFFYVSPPVIQLEGNAESPKLSPPSISGLRYIAFDRSIGITFVSILPKLVAEASIHLVELSTRLRASVQYSLNGILATLGISWTGERAEAGTYLVLDAEAILWELNFSYLDAQFSLPILLSSHFSPVLALGTAVIPSTVIALGYHFFVLPRRRARRVARLKAARQTFEEDSDARKERSTVESLLKEAVKKQIRIEVEREGLIIQEASYGPADTHDGELYIFQDVTTQLQALVRNSQLHIPGGDSRAALQGISDPAPFIAKSLRIRYLFRGRVHFAEVPDHLSVVLPLAEHEVDEARDF